MKTERRHELQTNDLADWLGRKIDSARPHAKVISGIAIVAATAFVDTAGGVFPSEFLDFDEAGRPRYFHSGLRAHRRTEPDTGVADTIQ